MKQYNLSWNSFLSFLFLMQRYGNNLIAARKLLISFLTCCDSLNVSRQNADNE